MEMRISSKMIGTPCRPERGTTLVEALLATTLIGLVIGGAFLMTRSVGGESTAKLAGRLHLQMEARRALVSLYGQIQEGIELIKPDPGATLPFLVLRDHVNRLHMLYLKRDPPASERMKEPMFRLFSTVYDPSRDRSSPAREVLANIRQLNFTAHGFGGVVVSGTLVEGPAVFSFLNMIRIKNNGSED
jgi:hypothetical protein